MKIKILIICLLGITSALAALPATRQIKGSIEGRIIDRHTQQPLPGVNIVLVGTTFGAASDETGFFFMQQVPVGNYQLKASMIGYQAQRKPEIVVAAQRATTVNFELLPEVLHLNDEIVVTADYFTKDATKTVSTITLIPREICSSAGSAEDIFRILQAMPGVNAVGASSANLIVRGGSPDENRTLLENIEIYNPLHFARPGTSMGIISIINPSLLQSVEFLTGGFPVKYGDKMSSVFEMKLKDGNRSHFNSDYTVNMGGFGLLLDGPLPANGNLIFSARRGFFDYITQMMDRPVSPRYWDVVGKVTYPLGNAHQLSLVGFYYLDEFEKDGIIGNPVHNLGKKYYYINRHITGSALGLNWRYLFSRRGYVLTTVAWTRNGWKSWFGSKTNHDIDGDDIVEDESHLKSEITYQLTDGIELNGGLFWKAIDSNHYTWYGPDTTRSGFIFSADTLFYEPSTTYKMGGFLQTTIRPVKRLSVNAGLRSDYYEFTGEQKLSPRVGVNYRLTGKVHLNAAYGYYYQTPEVYLVALDPANVTLGSSRAIHSIAGIEYLLSDNTKLTVEVYQKDLENTLVTSDTSRQLTNNGSGYSRGIEFFVQKKMNRNFVGSLAYTYSQSKRRVSFALPEYDFEFDQPHNVILTAGYKFANNWRIGVKFQYASGMPYTPIIGTVQRNGLWSVVEGAPYSARYPSVHKLDIRVDRTFHFGMWTLTAYLDVWNVYNRDNVLFYNYEVDNNGALKREVSYDFPIMPIMGIRAQF